MGIMDKVTALVPGRGREERSSAAFDALALRDDLDRWVRHFFDEPDALGLLDVPGAHYPDVQETDKELIARVDVPGFDQNDLELTISDTNLIISGERREEKRDRRQGAEHTEARYGRFVHTVPLPPDVDPAGAEARVERGVLTVRLPKTGARPGLRRVPVSG